MGGFALPPWQLSGLRRPSLRSVGSMVGLMVNSKRLYAKGDLPVPPVPVATLLTHASAGGPPALACSFGSVSCGVIAHLLWVILHAKFCLCPPKLESLLTSVLWKAYNQISLGLKARFPGDSQSLCHIARLRSMVLGFRTFRTVRERLWYYCSPVCGSPTWQVWDLILPGLCPSCHLSAASSLFLDGGTFFCWVPASSCRWVLQFGALMGGDECTSFYSTVLNLVPLLNVLKTQFMASNFVLHIQIYF